MSFKKKNMIVLLGAMFLMFILLTGIAAAKEIDDVLKDLKGVRGLDVEALVYVDYSAGQTPLAGNNKKSYNQFGLTRGYLTVKKKIQPWMTARATLDIHQDATGQYNERLKYLYAELKPGDKGFLTNMKAEIGLGHIPWFDFEEDINLYRMQGTMAIERGGVLNSADNGASIRGYFGGRLTNSMKTVGNHHYDGRFGSWHVGVYNGAGYHGKEQNNNKVVEGRLTLRPLPDAVPGLQFTYFGVFGEGNTMQGTDYPDYTVNLGMLSFQNPRIVLTAQYIRTEGNKDGTWVDANNDALKTAAYSFFGDLRLPVMDDKLSVILRYDHFDADKNDKIASDTAYDMFFAGLAYQVYKGNRLIAVYESTDYGSDSAGKGKAPVAATNLGDDHKVQVVWQIKY
ncbi:MAG: hypothetical protein GXP53_10625 [Deltaproteobacteria bacterium]|nr:hypothetical protein [Deltaproteobacteria bacterium]